MIDEKKLNRGDLCDICSSADCANCFSDEDFKKWIESQPKVDGWIPVSEELPEEYKYVLVTVNEKHNKTIPDSVVMIGCYTYEQGWILNGYIDLVNLNVTAWLPLPEPYKEENEDAI